MPRVSVVITTYNRAADAPRAIDSALAQTMRDFEIIVVDDGSTDDTPAMLKSYGNAIRVVRTANAGVTIARNNGIAVATGDLVAFLDDDDLWRPEKLAAQVEAMDAFGDEAGMCFTDLEVAGGPSKIESFFRENSYDPGPAATLIEDPMGVAMLPKQPMILTTAVVRRKLLADLGGFDAMLKVSQDTDLFFKLALATKFCVVNRVLASIDVSPSRAVSVSRVKTKDPTVKLRAQERIYGNFLRAVEGRYPRTARQVRARLSSVYSRWGMFYMTRGERAAGRAALRKAAALAPSPKGLAKLALSYAWPGIFKRVADKRNG